MFSTGISIMAWGIFIPDLSEMEREKKDSRRFFSEIVCLRIMAVTRQVLSDPANWNEGKYSSDRVNIMSFSAAILADGE